MRVARCSRTALPAGLDYHGRGAARGLAICVIGLLIAVSPASASDEEDAEAIVRARTFEGFSLSRAEAVSADGAAYLEGLLEIDAEVAIHATILEVLGIAAHPGAFEAIVRYDRQPLRGEIDASTFRARLAIPIALGHLARKDERALRLLITRARRPEPPAWRHRYLDGEALARQLQEVAVAALGLTGQPDADAALARIATDPALRAQAEEARARSHAVAMEGAMRALESPFTEAGP